MAALDVPAPVVFGRRKSSELLELYTRTTEGEQEADTALDGQWTHKVLGPRGRKYSVTFAGQQYTLRNFGSNEWLFSAKANKKRILAKVKGTSKGGFHIRHVQQWANVDAPGMENPKWKQAAKQLTIRRGGMIWKRTYAVAINDRDVATVHVPAKAQSASPRGELRIDFAPGARKSALHPLLQILVLVLVSSETLDRVN
eukprot:CAMPEP_0114609420 /NCGR_PEP_ID=MMETSP0168-20121206/3080_1 /TAXON_ID=95228 ORGANISM="Vannella sp., Strain DIVA3 517/6/12" /NCGR_SAMPLE_ID=MMETSP0168 /ASSEMBLY_ACC=CAM_ASM_000044 /LENGTH=198 /DNA_ID=CAMNT_0001820339 /DNA_START=37 /DNA_END=633 /DNA_ORIENTATION=-